MASFWCDGKPSAPAAATLDEDELDLVVDVVRLRIAGLLGRMERALELRRGFGGHARALAPYFAEYVVADAELPAGDTCFDLVVCDRTHDATRDLVAGTTAQATRLLSAAGVALIMVPRRSRRGATAWPTVTAAAHAAGGRVVWVDKDFAGGVLYAVAARDGCSWPSPSSRLRRKAPVASP